MSCTTSSLFLTRVVPLHRFGSAPKFTAAVVSSSSSVTPASAAAAPPGTHQQIAYGTPEWSRAMRLLYRNLLVLHRNCFSASDPRKSFGDQFLGAEFRRATKLDAQKSLTFYRGWLDYGVQLERGAAARGVSMSEEQESKLNADQKETMQKLRTEAFRRRGPDYVPGAKPL